MRFLIGVVAFVFVWIFSISSIVAHFEGFTVTQNEQAATLLNRQGVNCCTNADGAPVKDADWGVSGGLFWVFLEGKRRVVPLETVVEAPNPYNTALVWYTYLQGELQVKCFLPGHLS